MLACPYCDGEGLSFDAFRFACGRCGRSTPVIDGIWRAMGDHRRSSTLAQLANYAPPTSRIYERLWRVHSLGLLSGRTFPIAEELGELDVAVPVADGDVVVDVACSEGLYGRHLAGRGATVIAVDHSLPFLRAARRRATHEGIVLALVQAEAQHLPVVTGALSAAVMGGSMNEIGDQAAAGREMARVVRSGGRGFDMSLVRATRGRGRALQAALRPSGITFPTLAARLAVYQGAGFTVTSHRLDRVVSRVALTR